MSRRFEPLYNPLPSPCRLMRIFGAIVQPFVLARSSLNCGPEEGRDSRVAPLEEDLRICGNRPAFPVSTLQSRTMRVMRPRYRNSFQFPPSIIRHAVWLYVRFTLSYRDTEDLLAERGLDVSYETVRRWVLKSGPVFSRELPIWRMSIQINRSKSGGAELASPSAASASAPRPRAAR
jgi:hypothetical protein